MLRDPRMDGSARLRTHARKYVLCTAGSPATFGPENYMHDYLSSNSDGQRPKTACKLLQSRRASCVPCAVG